MTEDRYAYEVLDLPAQLAGQGALEEVLEALVERFQVMRHLEGCGLRLPAAAMRRLARKLAVLLLDQAVHERSDAPYISVWEEGRRKEIRMIYINPAIRRITGYPAAQVLKVGFNIFVPDDTLTRIHGGAGGRLSEEIPIEAAREDREQMQVAQRWEGIYQVLKRDGTGYVKDVATIERVGTVFISCGTLIDVTAEHTPLSEAGP